MIEHIEGKVIRGMQLSRKIGFPTINISNEARVTPSLYLISHKEYGKGSALVLNRYCEIHFINDLEFKDDWLQVNVTQDLIHPHYPPIEGTGFRIFWDGIMKERARIK